MAPGDRVRPRFPSATQQTENTMKTFALRSALAGMFAGSLLLAAGVQAAPAKEGEYANVNAEAICLVSGNKVDVRAYLAQTPRLGAGPYVWGLTFYLEQKLPGSSNFRPVGDALPAPGFPYLFPPMDEDELLDVATQTFRDVCRLVSPTAISVRGVVVIDVVNADPGRPDGTLHIARCTGFPVSCGK